MTAPRPLEEEYLDAADAALQRAIGRLRGDSFEARLQVLEACSSRFGGFDLSAFQTTFGVKPLSDAETLIALAAPVAAAIEASPIHPSLALSALARETLDEADRKGTGAYHTDFRLAQRLAELAAPRITCSSKVVDPACGAGILLVALSIAVCGRDRAKLAEWFAHGVCAADLSRNSLRAALLALASLTDDVPALAAMRARWLHGDSLLAKPTAWSNMAPNGFDAVIGNPPWEKVKLSKHEFLKATGAERHYGSATIGLDEVRFKAQRNEVANYSRDLLSRYPDLANGEPDLYIAFTALFFDICRPDGVVAALVPGGLIRSQGTQSVRQKLIDSSSSVSLSIIDNRARFFSIDSRFKFLAIAFVKSGSVKAKREPIMLRHERGTPTGVEVYGSATIGRDSIRSVREDLSLPEVRSQAEWKVFQKVAQAGCAWDDPSGGWRARFCREVDMTKERPHFLTEPTRGAFPLVEGRMVHQHRFGVKGHASGTGRKALWLANPIGASKLGPQFWIKSAHVPAANRDRASTSRVGFCDIAGQTNERSLMAALIPAGVVCGNKVPTIIFPDDPSRDRLLVWAAVANSFAFDWMLRRILTTTVNYFLLQSIPLPRIAKDGLPWKKLASCASELIDLDTAGATKATYERMAHLRAEIDAEVAVAYGLGLADLELMLADFPILDRGQPILPDEHKSTITRDTALAVAARRMGEPSQPVHTVPTEPYSHNDPFCRRLGSRLNSWEQRAKDARAIGAQAYVPSEIVGAGDEFEQQKSGGAHDGGVIEREASCTDSLQGNRGRRSPQNRRSVQ